MTRGIYGKECWCGNTNLTSFNHQYGECLSCGTLVYLFSSDPSVFLVSQNEEGYYGRNYWLHPRDTRNYFSDIYARAKDDLVGRNLHWIRTLLNYKLPPASLLDVGCAHGSFVALS